MNCELTDVCFFENVRTHGGLVDDADSAVKLITIANISAALSICEGSYGTLVHRKNF